MGLDNFILECEKDNEELRKNIEYYKNKNKRLQHQIDLYKNDLITWLESKNKIELQQHKIVEPVIKVQEVLDKIKRGNENE